MQLTQDIVRWWIRPSRRELLDAIAADIQRLHLVIRQLSQAKTSDRIEVKAAFVHDIIARHLEEIIANQE